jgi:ABC-2 type transport system ATP-binding protein
MRPAASEIVRVTDVVKEFRSGAGLRKKRVLDGISFGVREGEIFGFVGPNGAGKTTALKILMGLIRPTSGRAEILGHDVGETDFRRHVGFLPESPYFYEYLTGREILGFYARLSGVPRALRGGRVEALLSQVGLEAAADVRLRTYSKGMLQRIGIAQALVHDPRVVFLDEPMSGLDPLGRKEIRDLIVKLRAEGKTVFMNTHILSDVELACDRVAIIARGRIVHEGSIDAFEGGGERLSDLVLGAVPASVAAALEERFAAQLHPVGDRIEARVREKDVDAVLRVALESGASVVSITPHRVSLESVFLSAIEAGEAAS